MLFNNFALVNQSYRSIYLFTGGIAILMLLAACQRQEIPDAPETRTILDVFDNGRASLSVRSNNRDTIDYDAFSKNN